MTLSSGEDSPVPAPEAVVPVQAPTLLPLTTEAKPTLAAYRKVRAGPKESSPRWIAPSFAWLLVAVSFLVRLGNLHSPLLEIHHFRQTSTAITVWCFLQQGIDLMHPMIPVLGPPWVVPMELPIFQATAALLIRLTRIDLDAGCRLTNILYFYASAGILYLLAKRCFQHRSIAVYVVMFYLWTPFSIVWSRTSMIEFAATAFGLAYVYFTILWLENRRNLAYPFMAIAMGCLGALTKITSMLPLVPLLLVLPAAAIWSDMRRDDPALQITAIKRLGRALIREWLTIAVLLIVYIFPVAVGQAWVSYGDGIKQASPQTRFLVSANQSAWIYGTMEERLTPGWWRLIFFRIGAYVTPFAVMALPVIALIIVRKAPALARMTLYAALAGTVLPVMVFFNLYHEHDYYLCAVLPVIALLAGYGLDYVVRTWVLTDWRTALPIIAAAALSWFMAYDYVSGSFTIGYDNAICTLGRAIDDVTDPNECVVVADWDWSPSILYYARRRGFMVKDEQGKDAWSDVHSLEFLRARPFTTVVCRQSHPWFNIWPGLKVVRQVGPFSVLRITRD